MKYGKDVPALSTEDQERFWDSVEKGEKCWLWTGETRKGYGRFAAGGSQYAAHRVAWVLVHGEQPQSEVLDHTCRNPQCVNPGCLDDVTQAVNCERGANGYGSRTMCRAGFHDITDQANVHAGKNGRQCRECLRESKRLYMEKRREDPEFRADAAKYRREWAERTGYKRHTSKEVAP